MPGNTTTKETNIAFNKKLILMLSSIREKNSVISTCMKDLKVLHHVTKESEDLSSVNQLKSHLNNSLLLELKPSIMMSTLKETPESPNIDHKSEFSNTPQDSLPKIATQKTKSPNGNTDTFQDNQTQLIQMIQMIQETPTNSSELPAKSLDMPLLTKTPLLLLEISDPESALMSLNLKN